MVKIAAFIPLGLLIAVFAFLIWKYLRGIRKSK